MRTRRVSLLSLTLLILCLPDSVFSQDADRLPPANTIVRPTAYISLSPVPRGRTFEVAVVAEILPGFHVNANKASEEYLIPTTLQADFPASFKILEAVYPQGKLEKFEFSAKPIAVYEGRVVLRLRIQASASAPLGTMQVPLTLRYQACSSSACLPPVKIPVPLELDVAAAGATAHPLHPEIFKPTPK